MDTQADIKDGRDAVLAAYAFVVPLKRLLPLKRSGCPDLLAAADLFVTTDESSDMCRIDRVINGAMRSKEALPGSSIAYAANVVGHGLLKALAKPTKRYFRGNFGSALYLPGHLAPAPSKQDNPPTSLPALEQFHLRRRLG